jgi:hypothetical protein
MRIESSGIRNYRKCARRLVALLGRDSKDGRQPLWSHLERTIGSAGRWTLTREANMAKMALKLIFGLLIVSVPTIAQAKCLGTLSQLKANNVKSRWQETAANDGKPLKISITNGPSGLVYSAKKAGVLWLTGNVSVCLSGAASEITLKNTKATNNVPMFARMALPSTQTVQIVNNQIRLGGGGWDGTFAGQ